MRTFSSICLALVLVWNQWAFGGVHIWAETASQVFIFCLAWLFFCLASVRFMYQSLKTGQPNPIWLTWVRHPATVFFLLFLIWSGAQLIPLPPDLVAAVSPRIHSVYQQLLRSDIWQEQHWTPLTLEWFRTLQAWLEHLSYFLFFLLFLASLRGRQSIERWVSLLLLLALFQVVYGLTQTYSQTQNIWWWENTLYPGWLTGTYLGRNNLAGFLELTIPLSFGLGAGLWPPKRVNDLTSRRGPGKKRRRDAPASWIRRTFVEREGLSKSLLFISLGTLLGVGLLLTGSRGGILSFAAGCLIMAILLALKHSSRFFGGITALAGLLILGLGLFIGIEQTAERFVQVQGLENRIRITRSVWQMVLDHPLSGVGLGNFNDAYTPQYALDAFSGDRQLIYAHNDWLQAGAELGLPGIVLAVIGYLTVLARSLVIWHRRRERYVRCLGAGLIAGYIALGIHSFFDYNLHIPANILTFLICLALMHQVLHLKERRRERVEDSHRSLTPTALRGRALALLALVGFSAAVFAMSGFVVRQYQAEALCPTRINSTQARSGHTSIEEAERAVTLSPHNPEYRKESGKAYFRFLQGKEASIKSALLPKEVSSYSQAARLEPANGLNWLHLGQALAQQHYWTQKKVELDRVGICFDLARKYQPGDARMGLRSGTILLWLAAISPQKAEEAGLTEGAVAAFRGVLQEQSHKWKEVVDRISRYESGTYVLRAVARDKHPELRQRMLQRFHGK